MLGVGGIFASKVDAGEAGVVRQGRVVLNGAVSEFEVFYHHDVTAGGSLAAVVNAEGGYAQVGGKFSFVAVQFPGRGLHGDLFLYFGKLSRGRPDSYRGRCKGKDKGKED